jgi:anti-sigma factor RsiW
MARYLSGDLADPVRRRVARYIDENEDCYREYMRHREFAQKLERSLPAFGRPNSQRLDEVWSALQADLQAPRAQSVWYSDFSSRSSMQFSYGLAVLAIAIALMLPLVLGYHSSLLSISIARAPHYAVVVRPPAQDLSSPPLFATVEPGASGPAPLLQSTPSPRL